MKKRIILLSLLIILGSTTIGLAREGWQFEFFLGQPFNWSLPLRIEQEGATPIELTNPQYTSRAWEPPLYYSWRVSNWQEDKAWELGLTHHKLHLQNKPQAVEHFEVSHGYNLVTLSRAWQLEGLTYHLGAGVVLAHPQTTIRGKTLFEEGGLLDTGYYLAGPTLEAAVSKRFSITERLFALTEGKVTAAQATIPVAEGSAQVPNIALHGLLGVGYKF